eukprot:1510595-Alexandrium_andersonii.AAC.1
MAAYDANQGTGSLSGSSGGLAVPAEPEAETATPKSSPAVPPNTPRAKAMAKAPEPKLGPAR